MLPVGDGSLTSFLMRAIEASLKGPLAHAFRNTRVPDPVVLVLCKEEGPDAGTIECAVESTERAAKVLVDMAAARGDDRPARVARVLRTLERPIGFVPCVAGADDKIVLVLLEQAALESIRGNNAP
ncbi:hypothetical protein [Polyangium mundeleinium]|uniref:Uncharacterized protein n=1 Tax=Polyangium mundeleinium TaxID=2995306 RepID=A0ABT5EN07_9BACT|nr:hypothetical protein [Polyangium mundeleinium]MDC0742302.1 hypothetical protein [Polyangium mundeleinium]